MELNSFTWKTDIIKLIEETYKIFEQIDKFGLLKCNTDKTEYFFNLYEKYIITIKEKMSSQVNYIDRHKIIAIYIKSLLKAKIFEFDVEKYNELKKSSNLNNIKIPTAIVMPNEILAWNFIRVVLIGFNDSIKNIPDYDIKFPDNIFCYISNDYTKYESHFLRLLYLYRNNPDEIKVFDLAHIIFLLELSNDCLFYSRRDLYYKNAN